MKYIAYIPEELSLKVSDQDPVVQSIVSLTSSLKVKLSVLRLYTQIH